jgi:transposase InsO family protein
VKGLCEAAGMSRQNYYKQRVQRQLEQVDEDLVLSLVRSQRAVHPRMGGRKLLHLVRPELAEADAELGRDRLFNLLRRHDLLIKRRARSARTTDSRHRFRVYANLLKGRVIGGPHEALVSDITYIRTQEGFLYLSHVMDSFSRAVVGSDCSDTLEREGALRSLAEALKQLPAGRETIHHSDRGSQYCCQDYVEQLASAGVSISMTQENHCYENAQAERLNGILKQEYGLGGTFRSKDEAKRAVAEAIQLYNWRRPHTSLGYAVPMAVHQAAHPRSAA